MSAQEHDDRETDVLLAEIRSLEPPPGIDPPWEQMALEIRDACDAVDARRARGVGARIRSWLHPRHLVIGSVAAVAAVAVFVLIGGGETPSTTTGVPLAVADRTDAGADPSAPPPAAEPLPLRSVSVVELDENELDTLDDALRDPAALLDDSDDPEEPAITSEPVLGPDVVAEAEIPEDEEAFPGDSTGHYEDLLDELSDDDMDKLDALLAKQQPG